jgi:hypothetical protein
VSMTYAERRPRASRPGPSPRLGVNDGLIGRAPVETSYVNDHGFGIRTVTDSDGFQTAEPGWLLGTSRTADRIGLPTLNPQDASHTANGVWLNNEGHLVRTLDMGDDHLSGVPRIHGCDLPPGFRRGRMTTRDNLGGPPRAPRNGRTLSAEERAARDAERAQQDMLIRRTVESVLGHAYTGPIDSRMRKLALDVIAHRDSVRAYTADTRRTGHAR